MRTGYKIAGALFAVALVARQTGLLARLPVYVWTHHFHYDGDERGLSVTAYGRTAGIFIRERNRV
jgi:hypothetical protein